MRQKTNQPFKIKHSGFSIIEIMVVAGLMSIVGLAITSVITNSGKSQKKLEQKDTQTGIASYVRSILTNPALCAAAFCEGPNAVTCAANSLTGLPISAALPAGQPLAKQIFAIQVGGASPKNIVKCNRATDSCNLAASTTATLPPTVAPFGSPVVGANGIYIYGMWLKDIVFQIGTVAPFTSSATLVIQYAVDAKLAVGGQLKETSIPMIIDATAGGVVSGCKAGSSDSKWLDAATLGDIYYNLGRVGIGTTAPESNLHIQTATTSNLKVRSSGAVGAGRSIIQVLRGTPETGWDFSTNISLANDELAIRELTAGVANTRFSILPGGNVGIGTVIPRGSLDVNGAVRLKAGAPPSDTAAVGIAFEDNGDTGLFMTNYTGSATGDLHLYSNAVPRLTVEPGGDVGIGISNPTAKLEVDGDIKLSGGSRSLASDTGQLNLASAGTGSIVLNTQATTPRLTIASGGAATFANSLTVTGATELSNTLGVTNATTLSSTLGVTGLATFSGGISTGSITSASLTITGPVLHTGGAAADLLGDLSNSIADYATITASSDVRLKYNITKVEPISEKLNKVNSYRYILRRDPSQKKQIGFIAQELMEIFPELVIESESGYLNVNYMGMVPIVLQGFKESQVRIQDLESENERLKSQIEQVLQRLENLEKR